MKNMLQLTLAILKPDAVKVPFVLQEIHHQILSAGFYIIRSSRLKLSHEKAEALYCDHAGKFFHHRLVTFMKSGPIQVYILAHPDAIQTWRKIMGPTKTFKAQFEAPLTIRGSFGLTDTRNSTHGSDSNLSALKEIGFFFPDFNLTNWYDNEEHIFRKGVCYFNEATFTHQIGRFSLS